MIMANPWSANPGMAKEHNSMQPFTTSSTTFVDVHVKWRQCVSLSLLNHKEKTWMHTYCIFMRNIHRQEQDCLSNLYSNNSLCLTELLNKQKKLFKSWLKNLTFYFSNQHKKIFKNVIIFINKNNRKTITNLTSPLAW